MVGLGSAAALLLLRPLSVGEIFGTLIVALIVLIILSLVERPPAAISQPVDPAADTAADEPTRPLPVQG